MKRGSPPVSTAAGSTTRASRDEGHLIGLGFEHNLPSPSRSLRRSR
jgi:hypothetical protein